MPLSEETTRNEEASRLELLASLQRKSGFGTELQVFELLTNAGWEIEPNYPFVDPKTGKVREMDVLARYSSIKKPSSSKCELSLRLAIQIKQSGRSAVFFSAPKGHTNEHLTSSYVMAANDKAGLHLHSAGLTKIELLAGTRPIARSAVFAGSKDVDTATLYGAAVSAAQSCEVFRQATATHFKKSRRIGDAPEYRSWLGVVVINAPMFSCYREGGEIALEPCDIVCQKVWVETEDADAVSRGVIAVHLDKFAEFLKMYTTDEDRNGIGYGRARLKHLYFD